MTPERYQRIHTILKNRQADLTVISDKVHKPKNLAAIIRTCDAFGIPDFHTVIPEGGYRSFRGTSSGSHKWVESHLYERVTQPIEALQSQGFQVLAANLSSAALPFFEVDFKRPTALLLGTERHGVSREALKLVDSEIFIPMQGMVESFNVSVAAAIILSEAQRQRRDGGYRAATIDNERYQRLAFEWSHPVITAFCQRKGIPYPPVDSEGEVIDQPAWYRRVKDLPDRKV